MRSEREILDQVLDLAKRDDNIRAVIRTDLLPVRKYLYSYSFCLVVDDVEEYDSNDAFGTCFGDRILLYRGDRNYPELFPGTKAHLMVFCDGITLVINAMDKESFLQRYNGENAHENVWIGDTYQKILDKDGMLPAIERLEERQTLFSETPTEAEFLGTCDEFWWVMKTFAEYILRKELPAAMFYLNVAVRDLINKMLRWYIFLHSGRPVDLGILDSRLQSLLEKELFQLYEKTYPDADYDHIWNAFSAAAELFGKSGNSVSDLCGFSYPKDTENRMLDLIMRLREAP